MTHPLFYKLLGSSAAAFQSDETVQVYANLKGLIFAQAKQTVIGVIAVAAVITAIGYHAAAAYYWLGWMLLVLLGQALGYYFSSLPKLSDPVADNTRYLTLSMTDSVMNGLIYLSHFLLYSSMSDAERALDTLISLGVITIMVTYCSGQRAIYWLYSGPILFTLSLAWLYFPATNFSDQQRWLVGALALGTGLLMLPGFVQQTWKQFDESCRLRFRESALNAQLSAALLSAERAVLAKSHFLAAASHDLRQPLHTLSLLSGLLAKEQPKARVIEVNAQMALSIQSLERMFSRILDFSKLESDLEQPNLRWVALQPLVRQVVDDYRPLAQQKDLFLHEDQASFAKLHVYSDGLWLERILRNLLDNAIKYSRSGGCRVYATQTDAGVQIMVSDSGIGIADSEKPLVFNDYYQVDPDANHSHKGLGLGLAIVRRLAFKLGCSIAIRDNVPRGSVFELTFAAAQTLQRDETDQPAPLRERSPCSIAGLKVLYIEDEDTSRYAMQALLQEWGCDVQVSPDIGQALSLLEHWTPQVVLSDFSLAGNETGVQAIAAIRERCTSVSVAIMTGVASLAAIAQADLQELPILRKPVAPDELRALLEIFQEME